MKPRRFLPMLLVVMSLTATPLFATDDIPRSAGAEIVRMWNAHLSPNTILLFVRQSGEISFTADDVAVMAEAGLPDRFIRDLMKSAGASARRSYSSPRVYGRYPYPYPYPYPYYYPSWGASIFIGGGHHGGGGHGGGHGHH